MPKLCTALVAAMLIGLASSVSAADFSSQTVKSVFIRTNEVATTLNESNLLSAVPATTVAPFIVAAGDTELFTLQFTAQVELRNASSVVPTFNSDDVVELQAQAVNIDTGAIIILLPSGLTGFAGSNNPQAHAMTWVHRLGSARWRFRLMGRVRDVAPAATVSALLTNWTMTITRHE